MSDLLCASLEVPVGQEVVLVLGTFRQGGSGTTKVSFAMDVKMASWRGESRDVGGLWFSVIGQAGLLSGHVKSGRVLDDYSVGSSVVKS